MQLQSPACSNLRRMQKDVRAAVCKVKLFAVWENSIVDKRGGLQTPKPLPCHIIMLYALIVTHLQMDLILLKRLREVVIKSDTYRIHLSQFEAIAIA